ncbi:hypothetical protein HK102_003948 [Quaeritorhiza haematococci]|nr:hypothetical protein HK102_003948 [Quaeritorhiza haematococci]
MRGSSSSQNSLPAKIPVNDHNHHQLSTGTTNPSADSLSITTGTSLAQTREEFEEEEEEEESPYFFLRKLNAVSGSRDERSLVDWIRENHLDPHPSRDCIVEHISYRPRCLRQFGLRIAQPTPNGQGHTLILIRANEMLLPVAHNLRCSLEKLGYSNVIFWALEPGAHERLLSQGFLSIFLPVKLDPAKHFHSHEQELDQVMRLLPTVLRKVLDAGFNVWYLDPDAVVLREDFLMEPYRFHNGSSFPSHEASAAAPGSSSSTGGVATNKTRQDAEPAAAAAGSLASLFGSSTAAGGAKDAEVEVYADEPPFDVLLAIDEENLWRPKSPLTSSSSPSSSSSSSSSQPHRDATTTKSGLEEDAEDDTFSYDHIRATRLGNGPYPFGLPRVSTGMMYFSNTPGSKRLLSSLSKRLNEPTIYASPSDGDAEEEVEYADDQEAMEILLRDAEVAEVVLPESIREYLEGVEREREEWRVRREMRLRRPGNEAASASVAAEDVAYEQAPPRTMSVTKRSLQKRADAEEVLKPRKKKGVQKVKVEVEEGAPPGIDGEVAPPTSAGSSSSASVVEEREREASGSHGSVDQYGRRIMKEGGKEKHVAGGTKGVKGSKVEVDEVEGQHTSQHHQPSSKQHHTISSSSSSSSSSSTSPSPNTSTSSTSTSSSSSSSSSTSNSSTSTTPRHPPTRIRLLEQTEFASGRFYFSGETKRIRRKDLRVLAGAGAWVGNLEVTFRSKGFWYLDGERCKYHLRSGLGPL